MVLASRPIYGLMQVAQALGIDHLLPITGRLPDGSAAMEILTGGTCE